MGLMISWPQVVVWLRREEMTAAVKVACVDLKDRGRVRENSYWSLILAD